MLDKELLEYDRKLERMQQFHNANPDADLTDHYYWDDVLNAETDGYLDDKGSV